MKKLTACLLIMLMLALPAAVFAEGKAGLSFSEDISAVSQENFVVRVSFSAEEAIAAVQAEFTYNAELMEFISGGNSVQAENGTGSISGSGGAQKLSYALEFRALKAGTGEIEVIASEVIGDADGKLIGTPTGSVVIEIAEQLPAEAEDGEAEETTDPIEEEAEPQETPAADEREETDLLVIDGKKYIPMEEKIAGYQLLGDEDGNFWLYRTSDGTLMEYAPLSARGMYGYTEQPELENYAPATVEINGTEYNAYASGEEGFYFIYLTDASGETSWYCYDAQSELLQRADLTENVIERQTEDPNTQVYDLATIILAGLIVLAVVCLIFVLRRKKQ